MVTRKIVLVLAVLGLALSVSARLSAAPRAKAPSDESAMSDALRARYAEGIRLYGKRRYEEARAAFVQAAALERRPPVTLMLALSALKCGRAIEALRELDAYEEEVPEPAAKIRDIVLTARREAGKRVGHVRVVAPEGAEITLDGAPVDKARAGGVLHVEPGQHEIRLTHGDAEKTETVNVPAGSAAVVRLREPDPGPAPPPKPRTPTPVAPPSAEGERPGLLSPPATIWPVYVASAIGIGGLSAAGIFGGLKANADHSVAVVSTTLERSGQSPAVCEQAAPGPGYEEACSTLKRNEAAARAHEQALTIALGVGGAGVALAIGWYLLSPKDTGAVEKGGTEARGRPRVAPWIAVGSGGAAIEGRF